MVARAEYLGTLARLAAVGVTRRPWRVGLLAAAVALAAAAAFGSLLFQRAVAGSAARSLDRLGADAVILPARVTANLTPALLTVEPSTQTIPIDIADRVEALSLLARSSRQRTFQVPDGGGHLPVDLIAFEQESDFTILPWVGDRLARPFAPGDVIVGARRPEQLGERISFQGTDMVVHARLGLTGVGPFERGMFVDVATFERLAERGVVDATGAPLPSRPLDTPSGILVRLGDRRGPEDLRFVAAGIPGIQVLSSAGSQVEVRQGVALLARGSQAGVILGLLAPALLVGIAWTGMLAERRGEFGVMLAIGMPRRDLLITILLEALAAVLAGALVGVIVAYGMIVLLGRSLGFVLSARAIPFVMPSAPECFTLGATSILLVAAAGLTGACIAAWMAARREPWALIRGDAA